MAPRFLTPLRLEKVGPDHWRLLDKLIYRSVKYAGLFIVPCGFESDLTSIPAVLQGLIHKVDRYDAAAVLHDAAYANALETAAGRPIFTTKAVADALFHEAVKATGTGRAKAAVMYAAVRLWGDPVGRRA